MTADLWSANNYIRGPVVRRDSNPDTVMGRGMRLKLQISRGLVGQGVFIFCCYWFGTGGSIKRSAFVDNFTL